MRSKPCRAVPCLRCSGFGRTLLRVSLAADLKERLKSGQLAAAPAPLTFTPMVPSSAVFKCAGRKFSASLWQCQVEIQAVNPRGLLLQGLPHCSSPLPQPWQQLDLVRICSPVCCLGWAGTCLASPVSQQSTLPLPACQQTAWMEDTVHSAA